jgi:Fic family protein
MYPIPMLPPPESIETRAILKGVALARSALGKLNGTEENVPNETILIDTLALQEAKESSAVENIITTYDELTRSDYAANIFASPAAKEVYNYAEALRTGFNKLKENDNYLLTNNQIIDIQSKMVQTNAGFRSQAGTVIKNEQTGDIIYTPPQQPDEVRKYMDNLEKFINDNSISNLDPLVKMAIIHHQFESIHPFFDGNGRTGRIINVLYLVKERLLDTPILYLSRHMNYNKVKYYDLIRQIQLSSTSTEQWNPEIWEEWILFMLKGVEQTALHTIKIIQDIRELMQKQSEKIKEKYKDTDSAMCSRNLLDNIFKHTYTTIESVVEDLLTTRPTATRRLNKLVEIDILKKEKRWKNSFYINTELVNLLSNVNEYYRALS